MKNYDTALYAYCMNNPVRFIDKDGRQVVVPIPVPPPPIAGKSSTTITGADVKYTVQGFVKFTKEATSVILNSSFVPVGGSRFGMPPMLMPASPEYKNQQKKNEKQKQKLTNSRLM